MSDNDCASHYAQAQAHFQADRFNEGMSTLNRAIWCYETRQERNRVAEIHEEMAERCLMMGVKELAILPFEFAVDSWFQHGQSFTKQGRIDEACECYKRALVDCDKALSLNPRSNGGHYTSKSSIERAINDLECS